MRRDEYLFFKEQGICTHCRKNKAESGKTLCLECLIQNRTYKKKYNPDKQRLIDKKKREERKAMGLCVNCGRRPQYHGLLCSHCYTTVLKRKQKKKSRLLRSELPSYGICYICCTNPVLDGKKVCESCYQTRLNSIQKICYLSKDEKNAANFVNR